MSPRELLTLTVMVVLMPWLSDKSMEFKCIGLRGKQPWCKPRVTMMYRKINKLTITKIDQNLYLYKFM
ncbi:hypothetical protein B6J19_13700 [Klebsiella quasipneumoniae]|nr:hypothetical protein B6J19_13700 [Klebsiella quasipneumoniae]